MSAKRLPCVRVRQLAIAFLLIMLGVTAAQAQRASLSNNSRSFGSVAIGSTSAAKTVTLSNSSSVALSIASIAVTGDFAQTNTCGSSVPGRGNCVITMTFTPTAAGSRSGQVTITDNANNSPQRISLSGTGVAPFSLSPTSRSFSSQAYGTTSAPKTVTVKNNQTTPLPLDISMTGDFVQTNTCGSQLSASSSCTINVSFRPMANGTRTGAVTVTAAAMSLSTTLSGTGTGAPAVPVTLTPATLTFAGQGIDTTSAAQSVSLHNAQAGSLTITGISVGGDFGQASTTCGATLAANGTCTISVNFTPTATGTRAGTLTVTHSAANSPQSVALSGQGTAVLQSLTVTPANPNVTINQQQALTATGLYSDGTSQNLTQTANWTSGATSVATVATSGTRGVVTALTSGTALITASVSGTSVSGSTLVTVPQHNLVSIALSPSTATMAPGSTQQMSAVGTYSDGTTANLAASSATWVVDDTGVASINASGMAGAIAGGVAHITASQSGITSSPATLTVTGDPVRGLTILPSNPSVPAGTSQQFTGIATWADGTQHDVTGQLNWSPSNANVMTVSNAAGSKGLGTAVSAGVASIGATWSTTIQGQTGVTVTGNTSGCGLPTIDLKLLVVTNGKTEAAYPAITQILDYVGTPYTVLDYNAQPAGVTAAFLSDGSCHAFFQGVIFANGGYIYTLPGMSNLTSYEQKFGIRQVNWFAFPTVDLGFNASTGSASTRTATFTSAASPVFFYVNTATPVAIANATVYLAKPATPAAGTVTPLMVDSSGNALSVLYDFGDGRQYLTQAFDSNQYLMHDLVLAYGLLNWVTKGTFLGEYHVYAVPQVDDIFLDNHVWQPSTACGTDSDADSLPTFRLTATDLDRVVDWQNSKQANPALANFVLHMAFNAWGSTTGAYNPDTLTPEIVKFKSNFRWISHTWDHEDLNNASVSLTDFELLQNNNRAVALGLTGYNPANLVTPGISGLNNPTFINRAVADGVRYVVSDTSVLNTPNNGPNPSPNVGIVNSYNNLLYAVPRHANNLFFNVSKPEEWTAEYHCIYKNQAPYSTYTYAQIQDYISASFLIDMLKGDMDPEMFHQPNLRAYDGTHSLLGDLYDLTFSKYFSVYNLPVLSPTQDALGQSMQNRDQYNKSGVTASIVGGTTINISIPAGSTVTSAMIPVTGLNGTGAEVYGGQNISHISVNKGQTVSLPMP